jgi:hypothetical protein
MKVNKENNRKMIKASIAAIVLSVILAFAQAINIDSLFYYLVYIATGIIYILLLMYVIGVLQFVGEAFNVQNPFSIVLGLEVVKFISGLFFIKNANNLLSGIGIIELIIFIYIIIAAFKVKSKKLALPFRILGISFLLTSIIRLGLLLGPFSYLINKYSILIIFTKMMDIIPIIAIFYIIYETRNILRTYNTSDIKPDI